MKKRIYETPEVDVIEMTLEDVILSSSLFTEEGNESVYEGNYGM